MEKVGLVVRAAAAGVAVVRVPSKRSRREAASRVEVGKVTVAAWEMVQKAAVGANVVVDVAIGMAAPLVKAVALRVVAAVAVHMVVKQAVC